MSKLVLVSGDLMLASRVGSAARQSGLTTVTAAGQESAIEATNDDCCGALIDLRCAGLDVAELVTALRRRSDGLTIIACGPHVHGQRLDEARRAGCDLVVTRGQLDREAEAIFQRIVNDS